LGIEAPRDVEIVRQELCRLPEGNAAAAEAAPPLQRWRHQLRNGLNSVKLGCHLAVRHLQAGRTHEAEATLERALEEFDALEQFVRQPRSDAAPQPSPEAVRPRAKPCALLVEDNPNESSLLAAYLRISGYEVQAAQDGLEAITMLSSQQVRPDIVLLDMRMPRLDGPTTVSAIRSNPQLRDMKLFVVSGLTQQEAKVPMGPGGVDGWFLKPVNPAHLIEKLDQQIACAEISA
jgi:CheY-like chemotaxis protein